MRVLVSLLYWLFFVITMVVGFIPALILWFLTLPFDRRRVLLHGYTCLWASLYTFINPFLTIRIKGRENLDKKKTYVICPNHCSLLDIPLLFRLRCHFKWISKKEIFRVPFMGWNLTLNGYISLDRRKPSSQIFMMRKSEEYLKRGSSLMIFPEGTRSGTRGMGKFRDGAFSLAKKTKTDVLPVLISGTAKAAEEGIFIWKRHYVQTLTILPAVSWELGERPRDLGILTRETLLKKQQEIQE